MDVTCPHCKGTGTSPTSGETCHVCGGDGDIEAKGAHTITQAHAMEMYAQGVILLVKADDIMDRCNDIRNKCNDILEQLS